MTRQFVSYEAEEHSAALPGFKLDVVRTGRGVGPNTSRVTISDKAAIGSAIIGFPLLGRTHTSDDRVTICTITSAPPNSRWCGLDLEAGSVLLYGPDTPHTAVSPAGLAFSFATFSVNDLEETAERLELAINLPTRGIVRSLPAMPRVRSLSTVLTLNNDPLGATHATATQHLDALHRAVTALSNEPSSHVAGAGARINDRVIVEVCSEYAMTIGRVPTLSEMCLVAHVSERRLRTAFVDCFGLSPIKYFKLESLTRARRALVAGEGGDRSVGTIASNLGFNNFGRFAREYREAYGELPSVTLRATG